MTNHKKKNTINVVKAHLGDLYVEDDDNYAEYRLLTEEEKQDIGYSIVEELEEYEQEICKMS